MRAASIAVILGLLHACLTLDDLSSINLLKENEPASSDQGFSEERRLGDWYLDNTFVRVNMLPSTSADLMMSICKYYESMFQPTMLPDVDYYYDPIKLNITLRDVKLESLTFGESSATGIHPNGEHAASVVLPELNASISFKYDLHILTQTKGHGTISLVRLTPNVSFSNSQTKFEEKFIGPVTGSVKKVHIEFDKIDSQFSDIITKTEWELIVDHPAIIKTLLDDLLFAAIEKLLLLKDLRHLKTVNISKLAQVQFGLAELVQFPNTTNEAPDNQIMDLRLHASFAFKSGIRIHGVFPANMSAEPPTTKYSTLAIDIDIINKFLKVLADDDTLKFAFNQKFLDGLKVDLLKLDTTSLKEIFPFLEREFGHNKGVFFSLHVPTFSSTSKLYSRVQSGRLSLLVPIIMNVYVTIDQAAYYDSTLEQCLATHNCVLGQRVDLELYFTIASQFTVDKQMMFSFLDAKVVSAEPVPDKTLDGDTFIKKLDNLIDLLLPAQLPALNFTGLAGDNRFSVDYQDDQVAYFHIDRPE